MKINRHRYWFFGLLFALFAVCVQAEEPATGEAADFRIGQGDIIHIQIFQNPELTLDTRVSESGNITFPLLGTVQVGGLTLGEAEKTIASALREGGFVQQPQVNILISQVHGNQVAILGQVGRPGRYPLETYTMRLSELLAVAGGIAPTGSDSVILTGIRAGKPIRREIDIPSLFLDNKLADDMIVASGDVIYVNKAPVFYIYGEVQRPGSYRIERNMTIQQALIQAGGPTLRGTERRMRLHRRGANGKYEQLSPELLDDVKTDDVLYVRESLF